MKMLLPIFILLSITLLSCDNVGNKLAKTRIDERPSSQINFFNKIHRINNDYSLTQNAPKFDDVTDSLNKYALDSLRNLKNWILIVESIDDNSGIANPFFYNLYGDTPYYNLNLTAELIPSFSAADTIAIDNKIDFSYTVPKKPKGKQLQQQVAFIKTLLPGDTVKVSGSVTMINEKLKIDFSKAVKELYLHKLDFLIDSLKRK